MWEMRQILTIRKGTLYLILIEELWGASYEHFGDDDAQNNKPLYEKRRQWDSF